MARGLDLALDWTSCDFFFQSVMEYVTPVSVVKSSRRAVHKKMTEKI